MTKSMVIHVDLNREDFLEKLKEHLGNNNNLRKAGEASAMLFIDSIIDSLEYDAPLLEYLIDLAIEKLEGNGGVCLYDWHRTPFDPSPNDPNICGMCGKLQVDHELIPCCSENSVE